MIYLVFTFIHLHLHAVYWLKSYLKVNIIAVYNFFKIYLVFRFIHLYLHAFYWLKSYLKINIIAVYNFFKCFQLHNFRCILNHHSHRERTLDMYILRLLINSPFKLQNLIVIFFKKISLYIWLSCECLFWLYICSCVWARI